MKWLLILFLGIIIAPALAQNSTINQTDYDKLENSINGLQIKLQQLNTSINGLQTDHHKINNFINETRTELQKDHQSLDRHINATRDDAKNYYTWSLEASGAFTIVAFLGSVVIAVIIARRQDRQTIKIADITNEVNALTKQIVNMIRKQDKLLLDKQSVFAESIIQWIDAHVLDIEEYMQTWYPRYQSATGSEKDNIRNNIIQTYKFHLQSQMLPIKSIDLVDIFGKEISDQWLKVWIKSMIDIALFPNDQQGMEALKENFDEIVSQARTLKQNLTQFSS